MRDEPFGLHIVDSETKNLDQVAEKSKYFLTVNSPYIPDDIEIIKIYKTPIKELPLHAQPNTFFEKLKYLIRGYK